ncbi:hypothetical protein SLS56_011934 [Neofusicoccum ribis]|uniref:Major facilitator superfamily (MFS) profile domain-containing protein n=1 Tax=Neofusicoccum ribis TaxID=45134 RepID=A0ABR3SAJ8_9PEZI
MVPPYVRISIIVAVGGFLFGLETGSIGPVTIMDSFTATVGHFNATIHGVIISTILITAAFSSLISGNVAEIYGRPKTMMFGGAVFGVGTALEASAQNLAMFICGRIIAGIGEGFTLSLPVVYICEVSPAKRRGPLASLPQFAAVLGIACGYFICYGTSRINNSTASWRVPLAFQSILGFTFTVCCTLVPQSPRWLLAKGRPTEAARALARLGIQPDQHDEPLNTNIAEVELTPLTLLSSIRLTFTDLGQAFTRTVRKRTALGCFLMAMQQFSGIDGILYYAPLLFRQAGLSSNQASFLASGVSALAILGATIPATLFSDVWGRRASTIYGGLTLASYMVLIGSLYAAGSVHADRGAARWVAVVAIYLFAITFSATWAIALRVYAPEIQPPRTRASASSLAQSSNCFANFVVALTTPVFLNSSSFGVYFFFGGCTLFTVAVCYVMMPETKGSTLETIDSSFQHHAWLGSKKKDAQYIEAEGGVDMIQDGFVLREV